MKILVEINQKASVAAGHEAPNSTEVIDIPVEKIPADVRQVIAEAWNPVTGKIEVRTPKGSSKGLTLTLPLTAERVIEEMSALKAQIAAWALEAEQHEAEEKRRRAEQLAERRAATLAVIKERKTQPYYFHNHAVTGAAPAWPFDPDHDVMKSPEALAWVAEIDAANAYLVGEHTAKLEAEAAAKAAREAKEDAYLTGWVTAHPKLQKQHAEGLLSRQGLINLLERSALTAAGVPRSCEWQSCGDRNCPCGKSELDSISTADYAKWDALRATLPEGTTAKFYSVRECEEEDEDDDAKVELLTVADISIPVGPFTFTRPDVRLS